MLVKRKYFRVAMKHLNSLVNKLINNNRINITISFCIETLFVTNSWIILYTKLNDYLYFRFPITLKETFYRSGFGNPEPFEVPLYLIFSFLFICIILYYRAFFSRYDRVVEGFFKNKPMYHIARYITFFFLLLLFISKLGNFPLMGELYSVQSQIHRETYFVFFFSYLATILFITFEIFTVKKILDYKKIYVPIVTIIVLLLIAVTTFVPRFVISIPDASLFYGPIFEVASGKTIFTDIPSQYGFISILFFAILYKISNINFVYLPIFIWLMYIIEYYVCFYLIYKISKSLPLSLFGLFSIITINYYAATYGPQATPMRWLPIFLVILLFYMLKKIDSKILSFSVALLSLWNIDSGMALIAGYLFTLFIFFLSKKIQIKQFFAAIIMFCISLFSLVICIEFLHFLFGFHLINFIKMYHSIQKNAVVGLIMVPIEFSTFFWLVMLIYFFTVANFFRNKSRVFTDQLVIVSANFMLFASIYYVGRSMPHELFTISVFALLTFFLLLGSKYRTILSRQKKSIILLMVFIFLIAVPGFYRKEYITGKILDRYSGFMNGNIFTSYIDENLQKSYTQQAISLSTMIKEKEILILSPEDTFLFFLTKKKNLLDASPVWASIDMVSETAPAIKRASSICPKKILIDCLLVHKCLPYQSFSERSKALPFVFAGIEKNCNVIYHPIYCINQLCIAESKNR